MYVNRAGNSCVAVAQAEDAVEQLHSKKEEAVEAKVQNVQNVQSAEN